jgi:hypothetical protein
MGWVAGPLDVACAQVELLGVCMEHKPWMLVLEFMPYGNLKSVLQVRSRQWRKGDYGHAMVWFWF